MKDKDCGNYWLPCTTVHTRYNITAACIQRLSWQKILQAF